MLLWSGVSGQLLPSAIIIMLLLSGVGGQLLSSCCCGQGLVVSDYHQLLSSCCCGQGLAVSYYHHVAVVRGWWSAIIIILLWSGVGGQLCTRSLEGPFRNAFGKNKMIPA